MKDDLHNEIIDVSINIIAVVALPLNGIVYFALQQSEYQFPRYIPPVLWLIVTLLAFSKGRIHTQLKTWIMIALLFLAGCFNLLLGLLDTASLWLILAIIFSLFVAEKNAALYVFFISFITILATGVSMMAGVGFIPLDYQFQNCQFACVAVRIMHFLLIGFLIYYILNKFFNTINANLSELQDKAGELEKMNLALSREMNEKKEIQQKIFDTVILTEEKERKRFASDLHDGLSPVLSAINLYYQAYIDAPDAVNKSEIETKLKGTIGNAIEDVSRISHNISPHILENYGLTAALEDFISQLNGSENLKFEVNFERIQRFELKNELTIYRTITELINNTIKHSSASLVCLDLHVSGDRIEVRYRDNGKGFSPEEALKSRSGTGLKNIQNRIRSLNGTIVFNTQPGNGMDVKIDIPCHVTDPDPHD